MKKIFSFAVAMLASALVPAHANALPGDLGESSIVGEWCSKDCKSDDTIYVWQEPSSLFFRWGNAICKLDQLITQLDRFAGPYCYSAVKRQSTDAARVDIKASLHGLHVKIISKDNTDLLNDTFRKKSVLAAS